jgi:hypothetical protein
LVFFLFLFFFVNHHRVCVFATFRRQMPLHETDLFLP